MLLNHKTETKEEPGKQVSGEEHRHNDDGEEDPNADPVKNKRMGIFHYNEGNKAMREEKWQEAITNYKMALHHDKNFQEAYINLSNAYLNNRNYSDALETLQTLERINPAHPLLFYNLACYHSLTGNPAASLESLKKSVQLGYRDFAVLKTDPDLENLRNDPGFKEWVQTLDGFEE